MTAIDEGASPSNAKSHYAGEVINDLPQEQRGGLVAVRLSHLLDLLDTQYRRLPELDDLRGLVELAPGQD